MVGNTEVRLTTEVHVKRLKKRKAGLGKRKNERKKERY
jgi:hypothetical protein